MLPVEVPANRSMFFITLGSRACKSFAVITPRMPPPSHDKILYVVCLMPRSPLLDFPRSRKAER